MLSKLDAAVLTPHVDVILKYLSVENGWLTLVMTKGSFGLCMFHRKQPQPLAPVALGLRDGKLRGR